MARQPSVFVDMARLRVECVDGDCAALPVALACCGPY